MSWSPSPSRLWFVVSPVAQMVSQNTVRNTNEITHHSRFGDVALILLESLTRWPTSEPNSPMTLPRGQYSQTRNLTGLADAKSTWFFIWQRTERYHCFNPQSLLPQPTVVVFFQTSWVKWPEDSVKLGSL